VGGFLASLRPYSAFEQILAASKQIPLHTRVSVTTSAITATRVGELSAKPINELSLENKTLEPIKVAAEVVISQELVRAQSPEASQLVAQELRNAVALVTDQAFCSLILSGITPITSSGGGVTQARADITTALDGLATGADSKIFIMRRAATPSQNPCPMLRWSRRS
jgi:HK97 family phage major capsid protein